MDEHATLEPREYQNRELLQKTLKLLSEAPTGTAPLILCPSQEQADSFREFLQAWLQPMFVQ